MRSISTSGGPAPGSGGIPGGRVFAALRLRKYVLVCFGVVVAYALVALAGYAGLLPDFQERVGASYEPPSWHLSRILGTDIFGRSVLYKVLVGTQTAMTIGFVVAAISIPVGVVLGAVAGYYGGKVDAAVVWVYSVITSIPSILLIIAIAHVLGKGIGSVCLALGVVGWVGLCRLVRGEVLKQKGREYVLAARLIGASDLRIIWRHILPNVLHLPIVTASLSILGAIKSEVILTFLGVGIENGESWGAMIQDATGELAQGIWWPLAGVTLAMFAIIYALNVSGDALRDALDPRLSD